MFDDITESSTPRSKIIQQRNRRLHRLLLIALICCLIGTACLLVKIYDQIKTIEGFQGQIATIQAVQQASDWSVLERRMYDLQNKYEALLIKRMSLCRCPKKKLKTKKK